MSTYYMEKIHSISTSDDADRTKQIVDIVMSTNESVKATPRFADEVRAVLMILIMSKGFTAHLYHKIPNKDWVKEIINGFGDFDVVSEEEKRQILEDYNEAHTMVIQGMLCTVFGVEYIDRG